MLCSVNASYEMITSTNMDGWQSKHMMKIQLPVMYITLSIWGGLPNHLRTTWQVINHLVHRKTPMWCEQKKTINSIRREYHRVVESCKTWGLVNCSPEDQRASKRQPGWNLLRETSYQIWYLLLFFVVNEVGWYERKQVDLQRTSNVPNVELKKSCRGCIL